MPEQISLHVAGATELINRLKQLGPTLKNSVMRDVMKAAARPIVQATKALAPVQTGLLRQSIASVVVKSKDSYSALIGMRHVSGRKRKGAKFKPSKTVLRRIADFGTAGDPARYAHLVEFGHTIVPRGSAISSKERRSFDKRGIGAAQLGIRHGYGRVGAKPFMRPGLAAGASGAEQAMIKELKEFIDHAGDALTGGGRIK